MNYIYSVEIQSSFRNMGKTQASVRSRMEAVNLKCEQ